MFQVYQLNSIESSQPSAMIPAVDDNRYTKICINLRIPQDFHEQPVISQLISRHGITVNITAALLPTNMRIDGWFELELRGTRHQIQCALSYLEELNLAIWSQSNPEEDGW